MLFENVTLLPSIIYANVNECMTKFTGFMKQRKAESLSLTEQFN